MFFFVFFNFTSIYHIRVYDGCVTWMGHEQTSQEGPTSKVTSTVLWELTRVEYCNKKDRINKTILYFTDVPEDYCSLELLVGCDSYSQFVQLHGELVERAKT